MTIRQAPFAISASHAKRTASALRELARRADRGELIGVAVAAWTHYDAPDLRLAGILQFKPITAHWAVSRLNAAILLDGYLPD